MLSPYFNHAENRYWELDEAGSLNDAERGFQGQHFYKSADDFYVFISPEELEKQDEYRDADPYAVEENLEGGFQQVRISLTLKLARKALADVQSPTILDIGCGKGFITNHLFQSFAGSKVTGVDYSYSAIEYAARTFSGIDFIVSDAYLLPLPTASCDLVICNNIWEHVPDPLRLLNALSEVLKPGGVCIISTPSRYRLFNLVRKLLGKPVQFMSPHHVTEYSVGQVVEQLKFGGFHIMEIASEKPKDVSLKYNVAHLFFSPILKLLKSETSLAQTVFYMAKKGSS